MACDQGQTKTRRDGDGLVTLPQTHYARQPISDYHRHSRGKTCEKVRSGISRLLSKHIDFRKRKIRLGSTFMKHKRVSVRKQILVEKRVKMQIRRDEPFARLLKNKLRRKHTKKRHLRRDEQLINCKN